MTNLHFRLTDTLTDTEKEQLFGWGDNIFGDELYVFSWRPKNSHLLLYNDQTLTSHVGFITQTITVDSKEVNVAGVGSVVTTKEAQGHGYASAAMRHAATHMTQTLKADFGYLFCLDPLVPFYSRLGWQQLTATVIVEQPEAAITIPINSMILPCQKQIWPEGIVYLNSYPW